MQKLTLSVGILVQLEELHSHAADVGRLTESRRATAEAMEMAEGEHAARLEELEAQVQLLQNDNYDVITCITQEAEKVGLRCRAWVPILCLVVTFIAQKAERVASN